MLPKERSELPFIQVAAEELPALDEKLDYIVYGVPFFQF